MKKVIISLVAFMAVTTSSLAQYFTVFTPCETRAQYAAQYRTPAISYRVSRPALSSMVASDFKFTNSTATTTVSGYTRSNGIYVEPHVRTVPNNTNWDNFSTKGNHNPFTGSTGYRARDYSIDAYNYGTGHVIHTGVRGGQFYVNSRGNKTYVPKRYTW